MADRNHGSLPQVELLPGMPATPFDDIRLDARNALARALRPEYVGIRPEDYADITPDMVALASVANLRPSAVDVDRRNPTAISYQSYEPRGFVSVATTAEEFKLFAGSIERLGETAVSRTVQARKRAGPQTTADMAASQRSGIHSVERVMPQMNAYVNNVLTPQSELINRFREAVKHRGLARFSNEGAMRMALSTVRQDVFGNLLEAIGRQRGWSPQQQQLALRSVERRLFINRQHNQHITEFDAMLVLAAERNGHIRAIAANKLHQAKTYINSKAAYAN